MMQTLEMILETWETNARRCNKLWTVGWHLNFLLRLSIWSKRESQKYRKIYCTFEIIRVLTKSVYVYSN